MRIYAWDFGFGVNLHLVLLSIFKIWVFFAVIGVVFVWLLEMVMDDADVLLSYACLQAFL